MPPAEPTAPADPILIDDADPESPGAKACLAAYYATLDARFETGFDPAVTPAEPGRLRPPQGAFLIARRGEALLGCVGLDGSDPAFGEVRRLWVAPEARGQGLARRLMTAIEDRARAMGIATLRLDTNRSLTEAIALYRATGWHEIAPYNDRLYSHHWFEKRLTP
jgi:GNAT superfamily N-acetyltransferase